MTVEEIRKKALDSFKNCSTFSLVEPTHIKLRDGTTFNGILCGHHFKADKIGTIEHLKFLVGDGSLAAEYRNIPIGDIEEL